MLRRSRRVLALALMTALLWAHVLGQPAANQSTNADISIADVMDFPPPSPPQRILQGTSTLTRNLRGVSFLLNTAQLNPEYAYTIWWIVFNNPQFCSGGCGADDFPQNGGNPEVQASVFWATGRVSDMFGQATFTAHLEVGAPAPGQVLFGPGLVNRNAEIHLVVRCHGPAATLVAAGLLESALNTFGGGCAPGGPNVCEDVQFAVHLP